MKFIVVLFAFFVASCASGNEKKYTGCTPADPVVRTFLGIPLSDSIDFIRWNLVFQDNQYRLQCNYGIGKPNTNGFYNGGKKIELSGQLSKEKNFFRLYNRGKTLLIAGLNADLLHFADANKDLLAGTGGWSYTLNSVDPVDLTEIDITGTIAPLKDSLSFVGRTPCGIPGLIEAGKECYKLKWSLVLYDNVYKIRGTAWDHAIKTGTYKMIAANNGIMLYQLIDETGKVFINLLRPHENILLFTDTKGLPLVGNEDFSYTLSRIPPRTPPKEGL